VLGEIVDFENTFLLCYVRGPERLAEVTERLSQAGYRLDRHEQIVHRRQPSMN
jgi:hypothetical protein